MIGKDLIMATLFGGGSSSSGSGGGGSGGGDEKSLLDALIDGSITEISSDTVESVRTYALFRNAWVTGISLPKATKVGNYGFSECAHLATLNLPCVTEIGDYGCYSSDKITELNLPKLYKAGAYAFGSSSRGGLITVDMPELVSLSQYAFSKQHNLVNINLPKLENVPTKAFFSNQGDMIYETLDFPKVKLISGGAFQRGVKFKALVLRSETPVTLEAATIFNNCSHFNGTVHETYNPEGLRDGYIYVPSALVDTYKAATNWSAYAGWFRALEDYTVDGTITGELDESKI